MTTNEQIDTLLTEAEAIGKKLDVVLKLYASLPNDHKDKRRLYEKLDKLDLMLKDNSRRISKLILSGGSKNA